MWRVKTISWDWNCLLLLSCKIQGNMCYNLAESVGTREHWLWDVARKRNEFLLFSIVLRILQLGTTGPIQVGFSAKCSSPNEHFNQIENLKYHMFDFRLISLDCITLCWLNCHHACNFKWYESHFALRHCLLVINYSCTEIPAKFRTGLEIVNRDVNCHRDETYITKILGHFAWSSHCPYTFCITTLHFYLYIASRPNYCMM